MSMIRTIQRRAEREEERRILGTMRGLRIEEKPRRNWPMSGSPWRSKVSMLWCMLFLPLFLFNLGLSAALTRLPEVFIIKFLALPFFALHIAICFMLNVVQGIANGIDGRAGIAYWGR